MTPRNIARRAALALVLLVFAALPCDPVRAAMAVAGQVRGRVVGPDGKPLPGVTVVLANDITGYRQQVTSGADGAYLLYNVPANPYHLTANLEGFAPYHTDVDVRGAAPVVRDIALSLSATASTTVDGREGAGRAGDRRPVHPRGHRQVAHPAGARRPFRRGPSSRSSRRRPASPRTRTAATTSRAGTPSSSS